VVRDKAVLETTLVTSQEKCIKRFVLNVRKNVKCLSNLQPASQFSVKNVMLRKNQKDINLTLSFSYLFKIDIIDS